MKETIKETGGKSGEQEQEWSIPCSSICHKHSNDSGNDKNYSSFFLHSLRKLIIFVVKPKRFVSYVPSELN